MDRCVLAELCEGTLLVDGAVALKYARLHAPDLRGEQDALTTATAMIRGMAVVTGNVADFETTGAVVIDPRSGA